MLTKSSTSAGRRAGKSTTPEGRFAPVAEPEGRPRPNPVMLLQGIVRSRFSLGRMARGLADAGFEVYNLGGPSPRLPLEVQVARFRRDLERLGRELGRLHDGAPPVMHGAGHSMGGIVLRAALAQADSIVPGRVVAIATPFLGTCVADVVCQNRIARLVLGAALRDLTWHSAAIRRLATSMGEDAAVGVILGQCGFQPLLPAAWINAWLGVKDTDGTIQPASARGDGLWPPPADVLTVRTGHTFMAEKPEVIRQTAHFLAHGHFARLPRSESRKPAGGARGLSGRASSFYRAPGNAPACPPFLFIIGSSAHKDTSVSVASL